MTAAATSLLIEIPAPDLVRRRLAFVLTEASVLRSQLRVSARAERERHRLLRLDQLSPLLPDPDARQGVSK